MSYGIDLGNSAIKVVVLYRGLRGFVVTGAARRRVPKIATPEERKSTLLKLLHDTLGGPNGRRAGVIGLSGRDINLQIVQQPRMKAPNFRAMMGYELDQRRGDDAQLYADFCTLREPDAYYPQFLAMVGVGRMSYVDERIEIAARSGIDVREATPNSFALYAAYKNAYGSEPGNVLVLDLGAENMDIVLVRSGKLLYARNVSSGTRLFDTNIAGNANVSPEEAEALKIRYGSLLPPAENADSKEEEIRPSLRTAAGQIAGFIQSSINHGKRELGEAELTVDKIYLSGGGARMRGLPEYFQSSLKLPVEIFDPFRNLDTSIVEKSGLEEFRALPTDMAVAVGLAQLALMPTEKAKLSLLPDRLKKRRDFFLTYFSLVLAACALVFALVFATGLAALDRSSSLDRLAAFDRSSADHLARINRLRQTEAEQRDVMARLDKLSLPTLAPQAVLDVVSEIRQFEEEGITVREIKIVDPHAESDRKTSRRCLFHHRELGLVIGGFEREGEEERKVWLDHPRSSEPRVFSDSEISNFQEWSSEARVVVVVGEVNDEMLGRADRLLEELKRRLTKESRGQVARKGPMSDSDRPGWRRFELAVSCQPRYE